MREILDFMRGSINGWTLLAFSIVLVQAVVEMGAVWGVLFTLSSFPAGFLIWKIWYEDKQ